MILRDGKLISLTPAAELDEHEMARRMVGRELSQVYPPRTAPGAEVALRIEGLAVEGLLADISFDLRRGEILGFAGLVGAGRTELAEALIGIRRRSAGRIFARGREVAIRSIQDAMRRTPSIQGMVVRKPRSWWAAVLSKILWYWKLVTRV